jgi:inner membrane protein
MDWITHAAVGAAVGEMMLGKRLGNAGMLWGALFGIAPDLLEWVVGLFLSTSANLAFQGGATHSPLFFALILFALPRVLAPRWKRAKIPLPKIRWFLFACWSTHLLTDALSRPGVQFGWPIGFPHLSFNLLGSGDGMLGLFLSIALIPAAMLRSKKEQAKRRRLWWWGVGLSSAYLALAIAAKWTVNASFHADLVRRNVVPLRRTESPIPWNLLLWRGTADCGDEIWVAYRSIFQWPDSPVQWTAFPRNRAAFEAFATTPAVRRMAAYSDGWWLARPNKTGLWLADVQAGESRIWGVRKGMVDLRFNRAWHFEPGAIGDPAHPIRPESTNRSETVAKLFWLSFGSQERWQATPRLAGVPGALPELLRVVE